MRIPFNCRVPALLMPIALLASCGGGGSTGADLADAYVCGLRNCTESSTLQTDELSTRFDAEQSEGQAAVTVNAYLGKSANVFTAVMLAPGEQLRASVEGGAETAMANTGMKRIDYEANLPTTAARPRVTVVFVRDGVRHVNEVMLPVAFRVVQPVGTPTLARTAGSLAVTLGPDVAGTPVGASASGRCSRTDGSVFDAKAIPLNPRQDSGVVGGFRVDTLPLDQSLNSASQSANNSNPATPLVARCELTVTWSTSATGSTASTLNRHSIYNGYRKAGHAIVYDARL
ncbi:MAG: hypothetical protein HY020_05980 [Burkholderiales bacterium]|nr:hypothetical protein [Burkholderiales bacterium]